MATSFKGLVVQPFGGAWRAPPPVPRRQVAVSRVPVNVPDAPAARPKRAWLEPGYPSRALCPLAQHAQPPLAALLSLMGRACALVTSASIALNCRAQGRIPCRPCSFSRTPRPCG